MKRINLKLLEKIHYQSNRDFNSGLYSNINEYVLDEVIVPDKDFDRNALYQKYNISTENDGEVLSIFDMDEIRIEDGIPPIISKELYKKAMEMRRKNKQTPVRDEVN